MGLEDEEQLSSRILCFVFLSWIFGIHFLFWSWTSSEWGERNKNISVLAIWEKESKHWTIIWELGQLFIQGSSTFLLIDSTLSIHSFRESKKNDYHVILQDGSFSCLFSPHLTPNLIVNTSGLSIWRKLSSQLINCPTEPSSAKLGDVQHCFLQKISICKADWRSHVSWHRSELAGQVGQK